MKSLVVHEEDSDQFGHGGNHGIAQGYDPLTSVQNGGNPIIHSAKSGEIRSPSVSGSGSPREELSLG